jgi:hypothetical protein
MPDITPYADKIFDALIEHLEDIRDSRPMLKVIEAKRALHTKIRQTLVDATDHAARERAELVDGLLVGDCTIKVGQCSSCPLRVRTWCMHPIPPSSRLEEKTTVDLNLGHPPDWCPLNSTPVRITRNE